MLACRLHNRILMFHKYNFGNLQVVMYRLVCENDLDDCFDINMG